MPNYTFKNERGEVFTEFLTLSEHDSYVAAHPEHEQVFGDVPILDPWRMGRKKVDSGFSEVLGKMKRFYKNNTI